LDQEIQNEIKLCHLDLRNT